MGENKKKKKRNKQKIPTCLICLDDDKLEPLLESKICLCKDSNYHKSCLNEWVRKPDVPRCPTCSSVLNVEYTGSVRLKIDYIKAVKMFYFSGLILYGLSFIITIICTLTVFITRNLLAVIFSIAFLIGGFFLHYVIRIQHPGTKRVGHAADTFNFFSILCIIFVSLPAELSNNLISGYTLIVCLIGIGLVWRSIIRDCNMAIQKIKKKRNKEFRTLVIPKEVSI